MPAHSKVRIRLFLCGLILNLISGGLLFAAQPCEELSKVALKTAAVVEAQVVAAGDFLPPGVKPNTPEGAPYKKAPAFCRAQVESRPSGDSNIAVEVWLPLKGWNHKFRGQGNGGFAGALDFRGMAASLSRGYLTAATDAGHKGDATDAAWALHHPEKVKDFGYRAIHEMTEIAKTLSDNFYGEAPRRSYFDSCSDGGREALMEAQRFPDDYNGILAGAPANDWTRLMTSALQAMQVEEASAANFIPPSKLPLITAAVLKACDASDGVRDGILNNPSRCKFDSDSLLCKPGEGSGCLSAAQGATLKQIYKGAVSSSGQSIFPGPMPSSEAGKGGWEDWVTGKTFGKAALADYGGGFFKDMVYEDPAWDFRTANIDASLRAANEKLADTLNATDPHLEKFEGRGGKLILYHGWLDPAISPLSTIHYYKSVADALGQPETDGFLRLYMVPGMRHCVGGPGAYRFGQLGVATARDSEHNVFTALERWVEQGTGPQAIIATKLRNDKDASQGVLMTRPLCPFPKEIKYRGTGRTQEARSFTCANP